MLAAERKHSTTRMVRCALFTALIAIGAFLQIPVPFMDYFTLQFFFVLLAGILLGPREGAFAVAVYLAVGLIGFPVFAAGGGINYIFRPSFGYLLGFVAAAFVTGTLCSACRAKTTKQYFWAALGGFVVTYAIGMGYKYLILNLYLGRPATWGMILLSCFPLDMPGDFLLCGLAALTGKRLVQSGIGGEKKDDQRIKRKSFAAGTALEGGSRESD